MSSTYVQFSSEMEVPNGRKRRPAIRKLFAKARRKFKDDLTFVSIQEDRDHLWFHHDEYFYDMADEVEPVARMLVEELDLPPFTLEWTTTCDKPDIGQFGGGAFVIIKGVETFWICPGELADIFVKKTTKELAGSISDVVRRVEYRSYHQVRDAEIICKKLKGHRLAARVLGQVISARKLTRDLAMELRRSELSGVAKKKRSK